jgi:CBS domain-containing protein
MTQALVHCTVANCMSAPVVTLAPYDTLAHAYDLMTAHRVRRLPVLEHDRLCGMLTLSDILNARAPDPRHRLGATEIAAELERFAVSVCMTADPYAIFASDTIGRAAELMLTYKIGGLPVIDSDRHVLGIITESDLFRHIAQAWRDDNLIFSGAHVTAQAHAKVSP